MEKYSLVQRLGQGTFAVVWKARRKSDGRLVAVKQLRQSPESWEACKQLPEVRAATAISDRRHVVHLLEAVRHGGELFLVFEYVGGSLHHCAAEARRVEEPQVRWAGRQLLSALAAVHAAGLVHCDVKPENILIGAEGLSEPTLKLCDFGQATSIEQLGSCEVGTRWYRAPELLLGERGDTAIDIWSAGCVLVELFLRRPLAPGSDERDMLFRICGELGAPDEGWSLASRFVEMARRPNASPAAWDTLAGAGASEAAVALLAALLRYDPARRCRADRALRESWFANGAAEVPVPVPATRHASPETRRRQREEATAMERRILAEKGSGRGASSPPGGAPSVSAAGAAALQAGVGTMQPVGGRKLWAVGLLPDVGPQPNAAPFGGGVAYSSEPARPSPGGSASASASPPGSVRAPLASSSLTCQDSGGSDDEEPAPQLVAPTGSLANPGGQLLGGPRVSRGRRASGSPARQARAGLPGAPEAAAEGDLSDTAPHDDEALAELFWTEVTKDPG